MDKNVLLNTYLVFVHTRCGMKPEYTGLYRAVRAALAQSSGNTALLAALRAAGGQMEIFIEEDGPPVDIGGYIDEMALIIRCVDDIIHALEQGRLEMADDLVDALHFLPQLVANGGTLHRGSYNASHLKPVNIKWRLDYSI